MRETHHEQLPVETAPLTPETRAILEDVGTQIEMRIVKPMEGALSGADAAEIFTDYNSLLNRLSSDRREV